MPVSVFERDTLMPTHVDTYEFYHRLTKFRDKHGLPPLYLKLEPAEVHQVLQDMGFVRPEVRKQIISALIITDYLSEIKGHNHKTYYSVATTGLDEYIAIREMVKTLTD